VKIKIVFILFIVLIFTGLYAERKPKLAVMDIEDKTGTFESSVIESATEYLRGKLSAADKFVVIDRTRQAAIMKKLIREEQKESYKQCYDESCQIPLGQALAADTILRSSITHFSDKFTLTVELVDLAKEASVKGATADFDGSEKGLKEAILKVSAEITGSKYVEKSEKEKAKVIHTAPKNTIEEGIAELAQKLATEYRPLRKSSLSRLAIANFDESGEDIKEKKMGRTVSELLSAKLRTDHGIKLVERERMKELMKEIELSYMGMYTPETTQEIGSFLGAQALIIGNISKAGADYIISARLVELKNAEVHISTYVKVKQEGMIALVEEAIVKRSKSGAIFRSMIVPGWGQFYNGDDHSWKGWIMTPAALMAAGSAVTMFVLANSEDKKVLDWDLGKNPDVCGKDPDYCRLKQEEVRDKRDQYRLIGYGSIAAFGAIYIWSVVDAAVYGRDYDGVRLTMTPVIDYESGAISGGTATLKFSW